MRQAIIIVDHGSAREAANRMLEGLAEQVGLLTTDPVLPAHMELAEPSLDQAFDAAVALGAGRVVVFRLFLGPGQLSREEIPR